MDNLYKTIELKFDTAQKPKFEEKKGKGYIEFGKDNDYPNYLLDLYNESPKHGAIIKGKCNYIFGKGFEQAGIANCRYETWNDVMKKCIKDDELYRGFYLQVIYNKLRQISEVYHIEFSKVRTNKDLTKFFVKNNWKEQREEVRVYDAFNTNNPHGSQIYYCKEYNPSSDIYPLPSYFQGLNYIESDVEVSRHILGNAKQGFVGSTLISLNNGDPIGEENKGDVERSLLKKFTGSDGKRVVIMFNKSKENSAEILPLGQTMLTKEDFTNVNNLIQQEIFAAHQVTSPTLFGIKTEGQLGSRNEIRDAYEIFNNTYVNERQQELEKIFTKFRNLKGEQGEFKIIPVEPLKFEFGESIISQNLSKDEIRDILGKEPLDTSVKTQAQIISDNINSLSPLVANKVLESMSPDEIRSLAGLVPKAPMTDASGQTIVTQQTPMVSNDAIKNLTGRQYQNVMRIVRQFGNGKLTKEQASLMLKNGFGFTDTDVNTFLGIDDDPLTNDEVNKFSISQEDRFIEEFSLVGDDRNTYKIVSSKAYSETSYFADMQNLNQLQANVLGLIEKQSAITPDVMAKFLDVDVEVINETLKQLVDSKLLKVKIEKVGEDEIIKRELTKPMSELGGKKSDTTELMIRYSYEGPDDDKTRPFCKKMLQLAQTKVWSRSQIDMISVKLGYSVWDRLGGWYTLPGTNTHREYCRHRWTTLIVKLK